MAKREPDNLALDMMRCKADGFGCHYGDWKAIHGDTKTAPEDPTPKGWLICKYCGRPFKPKTKRSQTYCEVECQKAAQRERDREKYREYHRKLMEKKRAEERKLKNESCA
jgi:hypothetical protein